MGGMRQVIRPAKLARKGIDSESSSACTTTVTHRHQTRALAQSCRNNIQRAHQKNVLVRIDAPAEILNYSIARPSGRAPRGTAVKYVLSRLAEKIPESRTLSLAPQLLFPPVREWRKRGEGRGGYSNVAKKKGPQTKPQHEGKLRCGSQELRKYAHLSSLSS